MRSFWGDLRELQGLLAAAGYDGGWTKIENGHQFRSQDKAILNWFPKTGTISYGGPAAPRTKLMAILADIERPSHVDIDGREAAPGSEPKERIFVVHGHDDTAREQLELILHKLGLDHFVLANTGGAGLTIIEALEREIVDGRTRCGFGIVLMTPDDRGFAERDGPRASQPRPRQNVVLEMGMLLAALGRSRVAVLRKDHLEPPSDAAGIIYIPFKNHIRETVPRLVDRLREAGFNLAPDAITRASS